MTNNQPIGSPQVSILIPVYNKLPLTRQCLQAITENTPHDLIEVIVIDNASDDGTHEFLSQWNGPFPLKVVRNEENLGYAKANNQGARIAHGQYLLLLNNDTVPKPNWIEPLLQVFAGRHNVGAVGSKLLYPNGTIQHVGVITIKDDARHHPLVPVHLGHRNEDCSEFNKLRRFPAVTGACMMVRKAVYHQVGGLDEFFWNGFEDVDFCFKLLDADMDIYCQPESVVIHYESQSGNQRFVRESENLLELMRRWKDRITCQFRITKDHQMVPNDAVSIVIVTQNSAGTIGDCLERLNQTLRPNDAVVIVDNASTDQTPAIIQSFADQNKQYQLILSKQNRGTTHAAEVGATANDHPYLVFLNPETIVTPQWIEQMIFHLMPYKIAAAGPLFNNGQGLQNVAIHFPDQKLTRRNLDGLHRQILQRYARCGDRVHMLADGCLMVKRMAFHRSRDSQSGFILGNGVSEMLQRFAELGYGLVVAKDTVMYRCSRQETQNSVTVPAVQCDGILQTVITGGAVDAVALQTAYTRCVERGQWRELHTMLADLEKRYPNHRQVQQFYIAYCINRQDYTSAMHRIESLMAHCTPDDGLLDAALVVRSKIAVHKQVRAKNEWGTISLCMVVKNESAGLAACLNNIKKLVDEIIVVDTGSTDRTKDVATLFGARVFDYPWHDDFAAARNVSLDHATGDWILILDADEMIASEDHDSIKSMLKQTRHAPVAYSIETRNYSHLANVMNWHANDGSYRQHETGAGWFPSRKVRLFPRQDDIRFRFPVHERVDPDIRESGIPIVECSIPVHHYGCLNEVRKLQKARHYLKLGYDKLDQFRNDLESIRELAIQAGQLEQWSKAVALWNALIAIKPDYSEAHVNLSGVFWQMGQYDAALASADAALRIDPGLKEGSYKRAVSLMFLGRLAESIKILRQLLSHHGDYLGARFMLAAGLSIKGDLQGSVEALSHCRNSVSDHVIAMAVDELVTRLKTSDLDAEGQQFKMAARQIALSPMREKNAAAAMKLQAVC